MTLAELIALYRDQSQDRQQPYFREDSLLTIYANEAQNEACRRGKLIVDAVSDFCVVSFTAGQRVINIDKRIIEVLDADIDGQELLLYSNAQMNGYAHGWKRTTVKTLPHILVSGVTTGALHLYPTPDADGEVHMHVRRLPLARMTDLADEPEIREEAHPALAEWMLYRAYSSQDTELFNDAKARIALANFEAEFGRKASLRNEQWVRDGMDVDVQPLA